MAKAKSGGKICPKGVSWAKERFKWPSAYAIMAASKYCNVPYVGKISKAKLLINGGLV
jgi:hypothetical protein